MAVLYPSLPPAIPVTGLQRELDVLRLLESSLSEGYEIFHSVPWHTVHEGRDRHGEIDLVVLGPTGNILLLEIKSGAVELTDGVMFKMYKSGSKDVGRQLKVQHAAMVSRLQQAGLRLADGLATWVPRIDTPSGVLRIQATAGPGKTQLALRLLQDAAAASQRSLYVCYNRALADHITQLAPKSRVFMNFVRTTTADTSASRILAPRVCTTRSVLSTRTRSRRSCDAKPKPR